MAALLDLTLNVRRSIVLAATRRPRLIQEFPHLWQDVLQGGQSGGVSEPTLYRWRDEFLAGGESALGKGKGKHDARDRRIAELEQQLEQRDQVIGELTIANRILKKLSGQSS